MCWLRQLASSENVDLIEEAKYYTFFHAAQNVFKEIFVLRHDSAATVTPSWTDTTWWSDYSLRPSNILFIQITRECGKYFDLFNNRGVWDCEHKFKVNDTINLHLFHLFQLRLSFIVLFKSKYLYLFRMGLFYYSIPFRQFNNMINRKNNAFHFFGG